MSRERFLARLTVLAVVVLLLIACGPSTHGPEPPTPMVVRDHHGLDSPICRSEEIAAVADSWFAENAGGECAGFGGSLPSARPRRRSSGWGH